MQATTDWSKSLRVEVRGEDVVGHAGNVIPRMLADATGLTSGLSAALSRPEVLHDRGAVLRDVAVSIAGGTQNLAGTAVLRDQPGLFRAVGSIPTMWRSLGEIDEAALTRIMQARNKARQRVWELTEDRHGAIPPSRTCYGDLGAVIVIRIDASLVASHSDKQHAAGNFKGGYGFHPLLAWCDNTGELLAVICRPGNAGSNTAADHIAIIDAAIAAIPRKWRPNLLITIDGAGASHAVVEHQEKLNTQPGWSVDYSVGFDLDERARVAIGQMPAAGWQPALDAAGCARNDAQVAELTGLLREGADGDRLADRHAAAGAARTDRRRPPAVAVRTAGRLPLPTHRDQHRRWTAPAPRSPSPGARPGGGVHPLRQGHRSGALAIAVVCDQHRLGHRGRRGR